MAQEVKLIGTTRSPYSCRVEIALKLKGVEYELIQEDLSNKSADLLKYNPIYRKIPVLLHNGKPIVESTIIVEYIDEAFEGPSIMPEDPYDKANIRFWAKFIEDKLMPAIGDTFWGKGEEQVKAKQDATDLLKTLENQLEGKKFFGDKLGLVDIVANFISYGLGIFEEVLGIELVTKDKFPKLTQWMEDFVSCNTVKECLLPRDSLVQAFRAHFGY